VCAFHFNGKPSSFRATEPDVIVADVRMPTLSELGVLAALQLANWYVPAVLKAGEVLSRI
jgi:hypothetical protein